MRIVMQLKTSSTLALGGSALLFLSMLGCSTFHSGLLGGGVYTRINESVVILSKSNEPNARMYPSVRRLPDGRLLMHSGAGDRVSSDNGRSWRQATDDIPLVGLSSRTNGFALIRIERPTMDGSNIVWQVREIVNGRRAHKQDLWTVLTGVPTIASNAHTLGTEAFPGGQLWPNDRAVEMNGNLLLTAFTRFAGDQKVRVILIRSRDDGRSFEYAGTVATSDNAPWGSEGPNESALALLRDGSLLCVMRVGNELKQAGQTLLQARSLDGGETWTEHRSMPFSGVNPMLAVLDNGVVVCGAGRPGNNVIFSHNHGRSWSAEIQLSGADVQTSGYLDLAAAGSNSVYVVYELNAAHVGKKIWLWEPPPPQDVVMGILIQADPVP